jgi:hypothetical protein
VAKLGFAFRRSVQRAGNAGGAVARLAERFAGQSQALALLFWYKLVSKAVELKTRFLKISSYSRSSCQMKFFLTSLTSEENHFYNAWVGITALVRKRKQRAEQGAEHRIHELYLVK